jgi:hypothetical protein
MILYHAAVVASCLCHFLLDHVERPDLEGYAWLTEVSRGTVVGEEMVLVAHLVA